MGMNRAAFAFVKGALIGGAIGAGAALLLAPQSGEETRTQIRDKGFEVKEKAEARYADLQERTEQTLDGLHAKVDEMSAKVDQAIVRIRSDLSKKTADLAEEVAPES